MSRALALLLLTLSIGCAIPDPRCVPPPRVALPPPVDPTIKPTLAKVTDAVPVQVRRATKMEAGATATAASVTTKATMVKAPMTRPTTAPLVTRRPRVRLAKAAAPVPAPAPAPLAIAPSRVQAEVEALASEPPPTPAPARAPFPAPPGVGEPSPLVGERAAMIFAVLALAVGTLAVPLLLRRAPALGRAPVRVGTWLWLVVRRWVRR